MGLISVICDVINKSIIVHSSITKVLSHIVLADITLTKIAL